MLQRRLYFDTAAFVPPSKGVIKVINNVLKKENKLFYTNAFSTHKSGRAAKDILDESKKYISKHLDVSEKNIIFTSGATESNRIILNKIIIDALINKPNTQYDIITSFDEHISILNVLENLPKQFRIIKILPNEKGIITHNQISEHLTKKTLLICISLVHPATGILQPIRKINNIVLKYAQQNNITIFNHTDASQAVQFMKINCESLKVDSITLDGLKIGAMLGTGLLYFKKKGFPPIQQSLTGTPKTALIAGYAKAVEEIEYKERIKHFRSLQLESLNMLENNNIDYYLYGVKKRIRTTKLNDIKHIAPHMLRLHFPNINAPYLATLLDKNGFAVSISSACMAQTPSSINGDFIRVSFDIKHTKKCVIKLVKSIIKSLPLSKKI